MDIEKPFPLKNFSWGCRRAIRYVKADADGEVSGTIPARRLPSSGDGSVGFRSQGLSSSAWKPSTLSPADRFPSQPPYRPPADSYDATIEKIRAKLVGHLNAAADQMRYKLPEEKRKVAESSRPWNLRIRPAALKAPTAAESGKFGGSLPPRPTAEENMTRSRSRGLAAESQIKKKTRLSVALTRDEIAEDFLAITGSKPPRKPKKRAKKVQQQLDVVFPGLGISEITPDMYRVVDIHETGTG